MHPPFISICSPCYWASAKARRARNSPAARHRASDARRAPDPMAASKASAEHRSYTALACMFLHARSDSSQRCSARPSKSMKLVQENAFSMHRRQIACTTARAGERPPPDLAETTPRRLPYWAAA
jgi:hypothetical protein